jgi:hypothetical protein
VPSSSFTFEIQPWEAEKMLAKVVLFLTAILLAVILLFIGAAIYYHVSHQGLCQNLIVTNGQTYSKC